MGMERRGGELTLMSFGEHLRRTLRATTTTSVVLGVLLTLLGLVSSGIQISVDFDRFDSPWLLLVVPVTGLAIAILLLPLSYLLDRMLFRRQHQPPTGGPPGVL
jgi:hypothetical protein